MFCGSSRPRGNPLLMPRVPRARLVGYTKVCSTLILGCPVDRRNLPAMGHDRESHPDMRGVLSWAYWYRLPVALVKKIGHATTRSW